MSNNQINLGQIGYGKWGNILFRNFNNSPKFNVRTVAIRDAKKQRPGLENVAVTGSIDTLLADPNIRAVVVVTPPSTHFSIAKRVLESGRHLFIEKVFTETADEACELRSIADKNGLKILVDYTFTFSAAIAQMRELIRQGEIGEIAAINLAMLQLGPFVGESVYPLLGSHMLSVLNLLAPLDELEFEKRDLMVRNGHAETGALNFISRSTGVKGEIMVSLNNPEKVRKIAVYGDKGTLLYDMFAGFPLRLIQYENDPSEDQGVKETTFQDFNERNNLFHVIEYFYRLLRERERSNVDDAIRVNKVLDKIK